MWETYGLTNEDFLWAGIAFTGGIGGQQKAPCGALSSATICLGLRHRSYILDKQQIKQARLAARQHAAELVKAFTKKFGSITCLDLVGIDFSEPGGYQRFQESGVANEKCDRYVQFVIEKLYQMDTDLGAIRIPEEVTIYTKPGCPFCAAAKQDLEERGIPYKELSTRNDPKITDEIMRLSGGTGIVPILLIGNEVKVGFGGG